MLISVSAIVSDESGANVYAVAFETDINLDHWKANIEKNQWDLNTNAVLLTPTVPAGNVQQLVTGNLEYAYANLESTEQIGIDVNKGYHLYLYARDTLNNSVVRKYSETVSVNVSTTTVVAFDDFMSYVDSPPAPGTFAQWRSSPAQPNVAYSGDFFQFYNQASFPDSWDQNLYANIHVDPEESIVTGNVYTIAVETEEPDLDKVATFMNTQLNESLVYESTPLYNSTIDHVDEQIAAFYPNVEAGTSRVNMEIGKVYHLYSMVKDMGFNTDSVRYNGNVAIGTTPNVFTTNVRVLKK